MLKTVHPILYNLPLFMYKRNTNNLKLNHRKYLKLNSFFLLYGIIATTPLVQNIPITPQSHPLTQIN